jgi:hypothetical protein
MLNTFVENVDVISSHAKRISRGDQDISQDILGMAYQNFDSCNSRGKVLSVGEVVQYMEYRGKELRSGVRNSLSCLKNVHSKRDVFHKQNYFNGDTEVLSLSYEDDNKMDDSDGKGLISERFASRDFADDLLFDMNLDMFFEHQDKLKRVILDLKTSGYNNKEISKKLKMSIPKLNSTLTSICTDLIDFFEMNLS